MRTAEAAAALVAALEDQINDIRAFDFPTDTPIQLAETHSQIARSIGDVVRSNLNERTLQYCLYLLKWLGSQLRYIEGAAAKKIPWALISPIENMLLQVAPSSKCVVRARWSYNYSIVELYSIYRKALQALLPSHKIQAIFGATDQKFFLVSLPVIERQNLLLHVVLGHEIGHQIAGELLDAEDPNTVLASVRSRVGDGKWFDPNIDKNGPLFEFQIKLNLTTKILRIRRRGLEELISDLTGIYLFGPAFLFALYECACDDVLDSLPDTDQYYPPWRYRLRQCFSLIKSLKADRLGQSLGKSKLALTVGKALTNLVTDFERITTDKSDISLISKDPVVKCGYDEIESLLPSLPKQIEQRLGSLVYNIQAAKKDYLVLLQRLAAGVPPNEGSNGPCDIQSAFTIGWLAKIAHIPIPFDSQSVWKEEHNAVINRLVHKAIEYIDTAQSYQAWQTSKKA
jgi:hypothetical protein